MEHQYLRPVEHLKIQDREGKQEFNRENSLAASLVYLSMNGYIEPEKDGEGFEPTDKDRSDLRPYEKDLLEAVEGEDDPRDMVDAVYRFDFEKFFLENGLLEAVEKEKNFWIFDWTKTVYEPTEKYENTVQFLQEKKDEVRKAREDDEFRDDLFVLAYAYPSEDFEDKFVEEAEEVVDDIDQAIQSSNTAAIAAATAASAASCSAAASSAAACSAGAAGGAAGGAC